MRPSARAAAFAALFLGTVSISGSPIFVRWSAMPGITSAFYRMLIASVTLWLALVIRHGWRMEIPRRTLAMASLGGIFFASDVACYNVAVLHTSAGVATFLGNNAPLVVGLITWALTRKTPSQRFWISLVIAFAGALLIVGRDLLQSSTACSADLMAFTASVFFALYMLTTEQLRNGTCQTDTFTLVALSGTASTVTLLIFAVASQSSLAVPGPRSLLAVAGLGLICQLGGYLTLTYALGHLPATITSVVLLAVAPVSALLALVCFHEDMSLTQVAGGVLVLAAVWIISRERSGRGTGGNADNQEDQAAEQFV